MSINALQGKGYDDSLVSKHNHYTFSKQRNGEGTRNNEAHS